MNGATSWALTRLGNLARVSVSNVDKHAVGGQPSVRLCNYVDVYKNDTISDDLGFMTATATPAQIALFTLERGDVVFTKDSETADDIGVPSFVDAGGLVCGYHLAIARPDRGIVEPRFLFYALMSHPTTDYWARVASGVTRVGLRSADIPKLPVFCPPLRQQQAIARYLDRETDRIDELITQQEGLVAAMAFRRDAAVRAAVWPKASWRRVRNKNVLFETQDLSPSGNEELLSVSHITGVGARADMDVNMIEALTTIGYKVVRPGDLVINTLWGWMGALGVSQLHGIVSPAYGTYRVIDPSSVDMRFFDYLYRSSGYVGLIGANSRGVWSSRLRIYPETFLAMPVDIPPLAEQTKIADELDVVTTHLDLLSQECRELIALLKERRAALITAAVTGPIDVRSVVDTPDAEPTDRINSAR